MCVYFTLITLNFNSVWCVRVYCTVDQTIKLHILLYKRIFNTDKNGFNDRLVRSCDNNFVRIKKKKTEKIEKKKKEIESPFKFPLRLEKKEAKRKCPNYIRTQTDV